eukprot:6189794-Pleurochrysis_carterae.AAC.1
MHRPLFTPQVTARRGNQRTAHALNFQFVRLRTCVLVAIWLTANVIADTAIGYAVLPRAHDRGFSPEAGRWKPLRLSCGSVRHAACQVYCTALRLRSAASQRANVGAK